MCHYGMLRHDANKGHYLVCQVIDFVKHTFMKIHIWLRIWKFDNIELLSIISIADRIIVISGAVS